MNDEQNDSAGVRGGGTAQCFPKLSKNSESSAADEEKQRLKLVPANDAGKTIRVSESEGAKLRELIQAIQKGQANLSRASSDEELPPAA